MKFSGSVQAQTVLLPPLRHGHIHMHGEVAKKEEVGPSQGQEGMCAWKKERPPDH